VPVSGASLRHDVPPEEQRCPQECRRDFQHENPHSVHISLCRPGIRSGYVVRVSLPTAPPAVSRSTAWLDTTAFPRESPHKAQPEALRKSHGPRGDCKRRLVGRAAPPDGA
jgi:hypothetical protein